MASKQNPLLEWKIKNNISWNQLTESTGLWKSILQRVCEKDARQVGSMSISSHLAILAATGVNLEEWYIDSFS